MMTVAAITQEDRVQFARDGYFEFDSHIDEKCLDEIIQNTDAEVIARGSSDRLYDLVYDHNAVKQLALHPHILEVLEGLYGEPMKGFATLNFKYGTQQPAHSDAMHFNTVPAGGMCGVWAALEDVKIDQGPLVYYPGSHKLPEYTAEDVGESPPPNPEPYTAYEDYMAKIIRDKELIPKYHVCPKGHAIVWAANLIHGGTAIMREGSTRYSQVTHYYAQGREYYIPMHSKPGNVARKDPKWIAW
jgi:ectoine hydroxylase-related dioxygenase (phytanoyl-CoA dioxygenase family)